MLFVQPMWLFYITARSQRWIMTGHSNFDLSSHCHVILVTPPAVDEFGLFVAHPPRPVVRCTGLPPTANGQGCLALLPLLGLNLASRCVAACFLASFKTSAYFLGSVGSVILLFTSLVYSITKISLCVKRKGPCGPFCLSSHEIHSDLKTITHILRGWCSPFHSSLLWLNILLYVWWLYYENCQNHILAIMILCSWNSLSVYASSW